MHARIGGRHFRDGSSIATHWLEFTVSPCFRALLFLLPSAPSATLEASLKSSLEFDDEPENKILHLFTIASEIRTEVLKELKMMNITEATLFPGLDGFARSLSNDVAVLLADIT